MNSKLRVAVCSRSFSKNKILCKEVLEKYPGSKFNTEGLSLNGQKLVEYLKGYDGAIIALEKVGGEILKELPSLKVIGKYGVGVNNIDFKALDTHGVKFGWTKGVNKKSVAELTIGFMLSLLRKIPLQSNKMKDGQWEPIIGKELSKQTVGLIGCGHVGKEVAKILRAFGAKVLINDIIDMRGFSRNIGAEEVSKEILLMESDIISLHLPLTSKTNRLIGKSQFEAMKDNAFIVNTARGGLIDEEELYQALRRKKIAGAAFDVFLEEPAKFHKLFEIESFYSTPHIGGSTETSILAMGRSAIRGLESAKDAKYFIGIE